MTTAQQVIDIAKSQIGYREGFSGGHWNNIQKYSAQVPGLEWSDGQAWCDVFVCWCLYAAGLRGFPIAAYTGTSIAGWKAQGRWGDTPRVGAQVFFGKNVHTGLVGSFDATYIYTIEGNTNVSGSPEGDGVYQKTHRRTDPYVTGYGYPAYDDVQSAGPGGIASGTVTIPAAPPAFPTKIPAATMEDDMLTLIQWCYTELVGRTSPPSVTDIQHWIGATSGWTAVQVLDGFLDAPAEPGSVVKAYADFLHRPPSQADIDLRIGKHMTIRQVRLDISTSPEARH